jgi:hypothetical protein
MGILDDAIREHLDLKRQRGADPSEIDRLEQEALGPVRRGPHDASDVMIDEESAPPGTYPVEEEVPGWADSPKEHLPFDHADEPPAEAASSDGWDEPALPREFEAPTASSYEVAPAPESERRSEIPRHHEIAEEWEAHERQGLTDEPAGLEPDSPAPASPSPAPPPPSPAPAEGQLEPGAPSFEEETAEYQVEAEQESERVPEKQAEGDAILEETPDFLQETPDHDRLWFEQRPPRDFDFDG